GHLWKPHLMGSSCNKRATHHLSTALSNENGYRLICLLGAKYTQGHVKEKKNKKTWVLLNFKYSLIWHRKIDCFQLDINKSNQ
ncbi:hypothetical protein ACJX0J_040409, partial [Zea mays]